MKPSGVALIATLALGLLAAPPTADPQSPAEVHRVGFLAFRAPSAPPLFEVFRQRLRELGYTEGQNIAFEVRWATESTDQFPALAAELVRLRVDVIAVVSNPAIIAVKQATQTIPIVMMVAGDPVGTGLVASLARPGGNITGLSNLAEGLAAKRLELLKEVVPRLARAGILLAPNTPAHASMRREIEAAAQTLGVTLRPFEVRGPRDIDAAFPALAKERVGALIVLPHPVTTANRRQIVDLAAKHRLPAIYPWREDTDAGGLMAYGPNITDLYRRAATFVDKILKGAKPADLPVEQPTRFELVINLKTAKALGLTIPPSIMVRADQVIQ
jgi:putative ABC transport system substrate-binding protein